MNVFMMTDIEGVAGVCSHVTHSYSDGKYYEHSRRLLTAEVNAAVDGLIEAGADDVLVYDGHGPGAVWFEDLHARARLWHGRPVIGMTQRCDIVQRFDVAVMIGQHAMAGVGDGNQNHTQSSQQIQYIKLNDKPIGEIAQFVLFMGSFGIPLIFLAGDEAACAEAQALLPGITTAAVKEGLGRNSEIALSATAARDLVRRRIAEAVARHRVNPMAPLTEPGPYVIEKCYFHTDTADVRHSREIDVERVDARTVRIKGNVLRQIIFR